ncbi:MAG: hypothetical protein P8Y27_13945 [Chromatiaceae bacterium]
MRSSLIPALIAALLVGLLVFPASLPAGDAPVMRAENLGDTRLFTQPLLLAVANLDQRISTTTNTADRGRMMHQRARALDQLNRTILSRGGNGFAATVTADGLQRLRDTVSSARRSGDKTAEMTAILRLNSAILDQSFTDLLTTVARDWIRFAPAADFNRAFNSFEHRTAFNETPFGRAAQRLQTAAPNALSSAEQSLIDAYRHYSQRAEVYDAVTQSLYGFVKGQHWPIRHHRPILRCRLVVSRVDRRRPDSAADAVAPLATRVATTGAERARGPIRIRALSTPA